MLRNTLASTGVGTFESFSNPCQKDKPEDLQLIQFVVGRKELANVVAHN